MRVSISLDFQEFQLRVSDTVPNEKTMKLNRYPLCIIYNYIANCSIIRLNAISVSKELGGSTTPKASLINYFQLI